jgi:phage tail-like protein
MSAQPPGYRMNGIAGWRTASASNVAFVCSGRVLALQPLPGSARPLADTAGSLGGFVSAIGVAVDSQDTVFVLDGALCELKRFDRCELAFTRVPCVGGKGSDLRQLRDPHGMAIACRDTLYIADTGNRRVQIFTLGDSALRAVWGPFTVKATQGKWQIGPATPSVIAPTEISPATRAYPAGTWEPWDVAVAADGRILIADYANGVIHFLRPDGCWLGATDGSASNQPALRKPTRIAVDRKGRIYIVQEGATSVVVLDGDGKFLGSVDSPAEIEGRFAPAAVAVDVDGNLCLSDCLTRKIYFYQPIGDGEWQSATCCGSAEAFAESLVFNRAGALVLAGGSQSACQMEPAAAYPRSGQYIAGPLDSSIYQCVWHSVALQARVPQSATVRVDTFTSESAKSIDEVLSLPDSRWATAQTDTGSAGDNWDCLVLSPPGRYLWLRLTLTGDGAETPEIDEAYVAFPRVSSLQYLPAVYRQDAVSADFLDRFLSIFDTLRATIGDRVAEMARYFDPLAAPANPKNVLGSDFLSYLASWIGLTLDSNWPVRRRRALVKNAHKLYRLRGTPQGLKLAIELCTGVKPSILEMFRLRRWLILDQSTLGDCATLFGADTMKRLHIGENSQVGRFQLIDYGDPKLDLFNQYANKFLVVVPRWPGAGEAELANLQKIVALAQPAHTVATVQWAEPRFRIGIQSFVGVDTMIADYPLGVVEGQGTLGYDTVLGTPGQAATPPMRVGRESTIGTSTRLN